MSFSPTPLKILPKDVLPWPTGYWLHAGGVHQPVHTESGLAALVSDFLLICKVICYKSINGLAFEILIDLLSRFMLEFGKLSVSFANQCNRTQVNFDDIQFVFKSLGLNLADLTGYLIRSSRSSFFSRLSPQEQQTIEERLEQLDLVDYFEQQRKLKIVDDTKLNQKVLNHIRSKARSIARSQKAQRNEGTVSARRPGNRHLKSKKKSSKKSKSSSAGVGQEKQSDPSDTNSSISRRSICKGGQDSRRPLSNASARSQRGDPDPSGERRLQQSVEESDRHKSCEQIVAELMDEMISSVEDKFNGLDESFLR
ncbi:hypothetical protein L1887_58802 [Cichorium endivia]|nr:hypothetical protein L1887_58802 [Cichorium endivia]